jgi:hypothetical protein
MLLMCGKAEDDINDKIATAPKNLFSMKTIYSCVDFGSVKV